jgi:low temperature requirement protein LtrA
VNEDRSVKPFELFFDLVFVFAFTQVTQLIAHELSWVGLSQGVVLIGAFWLAWQSYTWLGTVIDIDEGPVRVAIVVVMGAMLLGALAVPEAFGDHAVMIGAIYAFVRLMQIVLFAIAARHIDGLMAAILNLAKSAVVGPTLILIGAISEIGPLEAWWGAALVLEFGWMAVMDVKGWRVSPGHFSERHGLIFIIALGEAVISIGIGAAGLPVDRGVIVPALLGLGIIVSMWWTYFDVNALAVEHALKALTDVPQIRLAQHGYSYIHLPMIIGVIFFSMGVKKTLAHTDEVLVFIPAVALCGGLIMYLAGQVLFRARFGGSLDWPRLVAIGVLGALMGVSGQMDAIVLLSGVAAVFATLVVFETYFGRLFRRLVHTTEEASWT